MTKVSTRHLLLINGLLWLAVGNRILLVGIASYIRLETIRWWYPLLSAVVFAGFFVMFTGVVRRYAARIMSMPEPRTSVWKTFGLKGYLIIAFMITLGVMLRSIPQVPDSFIAWFYCGLGSGLISAGIRFVIRWVRARRMWLASLLSEPYLFEEMENDVRGTGEREEEAVDGAPEVG